MTLNAEQSVGNKVGDGDSTRPKILFTPKPNKFTNARIHIADYYASLRNELDIYTEELLEKFKDDDKIEYDEAEKEEEDEEDTLTATSRVNEDKKEEQNFEVESFNDPYSEKFVYDDLEARVIEVGKSTKVKDYVNMVRSNAIKELKKVEEENLRYYNSNSSRIKFDRDKMNTSPECLEELRAQLFATKFSFLVLVEEFENKSVFKLFTFIVDFYLNDNDIGILGKFLNRHISRVEDVKITLDEKNLLLHLIWKYVRDKLVHLKHGTQIIRLDKKFLLGIEKIVFNHEKVEIEKVKLDDSLDLLNLRSLELSPNSSYIKDINLDGCPRLEYLQLKFTILDAIRFENLPNLRKLWLNNCWNTKLNPSFLSSLVSLEILGLYNSRDAHELTLQGLESLKWLYLEQNRIESLDVDLFQSLRKSGLVVLDLSWNSIGDFQASCIKNLDLTLLKKLDLSWNELSELDVEWFCGLGNLEELILRKNSIKRIDLNRLNCFSKLKKLDLSVNKVENLTAGIFSNLKSLRWLDLSENPVKKIEKNVFIGLDSLNELYLNKMGDPDSGLFEDVNIFNGLSHLTKLELQSNRIKIIDPDVFNNIPDLLELDLFDNLVDLEEGTFAALKHLTNLDLGRNSLKELRPNVFESLVNLEILYLGANKLNSQLNEEAFNGLNNLNELSLWCNNLTSFSVSILSKMGKVEFIDLEGNPIEDGQAVVANFKNFNVDVNFKF